MEKLADATAELNILIIRDCLMTDNNNPLVQLKGRNNVTTFSTLTIMDTYIDQVLSFDCIIFNISEKNIEDSPARIIEQIRDKEYKGMIVVCPINNQVPPELFEAGADHVVDYDHEAITDIFYSIKTKKTSTC